MTWRKFFFRLGAASMAIISIWPLMLCFAICADDVNAFCHKMFVLLAVSMVTAIVSFVLSEFIDS